MSQKSQTIQEILVGCVWEPKVNCIYYWIHLDVTKYQNVAEWIAQIPDKSRVFLMSSHATQSIYEVDYQDGDWLVFGKESVGLSLEVLAQFENHLKIPMSNLIRSFNIANSVAFVVGEAKRQIAVSSRS